MVTAPASTTAGLRRQGSLDVLAWPSLDALGVDAFVTTRHGGVSAGPYATLNLALHVGDTPADVVVNRRRVAAALGADLDDFVFCQQAHGRRVAVVSPADQGRGALSLDHAVASTDALVTTDPDTVLVIMVADCVPIILIDPQAQVLACVHAGWRGTVAGVTGAALHAMQGLGARPERMRAAIGPAVAAGRYQVGPEVAAAAERFFGGNLDGIMRPDGSGRWLMDLPAANRRVIRESGVPDGQIYGSGLTTSTRVAGGPGMTGQGPELFFSDRAARPCGRFAAVARLRPKEDT
ncbi:MAG: polyphenol oxidase family protein [Streptosporangiaceae bacterium]